MINNWLTQNECNGCGMCGNVCDFNAIRMISDDKGFYRPIIGDGCKNCYKCMDACERRMSLKNNEECNFSKVYAAWSRDEQVRFLSTSGGVVTEIAKVILEYGGKIIGAVYDDECNVYHEVIDNKEDISKIRQSKYVQSACNDIYLRAKAILDNDEYLMFCGTPCQIAALKAFLNGRNVEKLYTLDFICMGVASPLVYRAWLDELEKIHGRKATQVWFKYKEYGWRLSPYVTKITFGDINIVLDKEHNDYMRGYVEHKLFIRPSCANCQFKGKKSLSEFTVGDFWGLTQGEDGDNGTSVVLLNNEKAYQLFPKIADRLVISEKTFDDVRRGNRHFYESVQVSDKEELFYDALKEKTFSEAIKSIEACILQNRRL